MNSFRGEMMLRLARELAISHGTFFAAALLADMGIPLSIALEALTCQFSHKTRVRVVRDSGNCDLRR